MRYFLLIIAILIAPSCPGQAQDVSIPIQQVDNRLDFEAGSFSRFLDCHYANLAVADTSSPLRVYWRGGQLTDSGWISKVGSTDTLYGPNNALPGDTLNYCSYVSVARNYACLTPLSGQAINYWADFQMAIDTASSRNLHPDDIVASLGIACMSWGYVPDTIYTVRNLMVSDFDRASGEYTPAAMSFYLPEMIRVRKISTGEVCTLSGENCGLAVVLATAGKAMVIVDSVKIYDEYGRQLAEDREFRKQILANFPRQDDYETDYFRRQTSQSAPAGVSR